MQVSTITLGLAAVGGKALFDTIGITMPAFRVAGGILLFLFSLEMLFEKKTDRQIELATSVIEHLKALKVAIGREFIIIPPCLLHQ
jgi:small neutral amino acid transporter SnatA (MarC family)